MTQCILAFSVFYSCQSKTPGSPILFIRCCRLRIVTKCGRLQVCCSESCLLLLFYLLDLLFAPLSYQLTSVLTSISGPPSSRIFLPKYRMSRKQFITYLQWLIRVSKFSFQQALLLYDDNEGSHFSKKYISLISPLEGLCYISLLSYSSKLINDILCINKIGYDIQSCFRDSILFLYFIF